MHDDGDGLQRRRPVRDHLHERHPRCDELQLRAVRAGNVDGDLHRAVHHHEAQGFAHGRIRSGGLRRRRRERGRPAHRERRWAARHRGRHGRRPGQVDGCRSDPPVRSNHHRTVQRHREHWTRPRWRRRGNRHLRGQHDLGSRRSRVEHSRGRVQRQHGRRSTDDQEHEWNAASARSGIGARAGQHRERPGQDHPVAQRSQTKMGAAAHEPRPLRIPGRVVRLTSGRRRRHGSHRRRGRHSRCDRRRRPRCAIA